ncbi:hypothetical protein ACMZ62_09275 [Streptococcus pluranimalium]
MAKKFNKHQQEKEAKHSLKQKLRLQNKERDAEKTTVSSDSANFYDKLMEHTARKDPIMRKITNWKPADPNDPTEPYYRKLSDDDLYRDIHHLPKDADVSHRTSIFDNDDITPKKPFFTTISDKELDKIMNGNDTITTMNNKEGLSNDENYND